MWRAAHLDVARAAVDARRNGGRTPDPSVALHVL